MNAKPDFLPRPPAGGLDFIPDDTECGRLARSVDEPNLWALVSEWEGAGFYRRALSAARMAMYPLMILMVNEPSAFEDVYLQDGE